MISLADQEFGRLVLAEFIDKNKGRDNFYQVITFVPNNQRIGTLIGYYKSDVEKFSYKVYNRDNRKELDSFDNTQLVECQ